MNFILWHFISGWSFFTGVLLIIAGIGAAFIRHGVDS